MTRSTLEKKSIVLETDTFHKAAVIAASGLYGRTSASNILRIFLDSDALNRVYEEVIAYYPQLLTGVKNG